MIEANPRASRTVPFVSKAIGVPLAKVACRLMLGERLADMDLAAAPHPRARVGEGGRAAVRPLPARRRAARPGDEVDRRGDGRRRRLPGRVRQGAGRRRRASCRPAGTVFISVTDGDKPTATQLAASLHDLGFKVLATGGTAQAIRRMGVPVERIKKLSEGSPNVVERIEAGEVDLVINTPTGSGARADGYEIRRAAVARGIPCITTMTRRERRPARDPGAAQRGARGGLAPGAARPRARASARPVGMSVPPTRRSRARSRRPSGAWPRSRRRARSAPTS